MLRAVEGAEDEGHLAVGLIGRHGVSANDVLIAVAASGSTPFTVACTRAAAARGALTVGIANNPGTPLLVAAQYPVLLSTGAEPIAGSTRMNAGTAQRITLNLLSTLLMIRLGRVYRGLMVDVQAVNAKITKRKEDMLSYLMGGSRDEIRRALEEADGSVKLAVLLLRGCDASRARQMLADAGGRLRLAVERLTAAGKAAGTTR
jgi:N-acetylmuramic acid 6-phosphate etherase